MQHSEHHHALHSDIKGGQGYKTAHPHQNDSNNTHDEVVAIPESQRLSTPTKPKQFPSATSIDTQDDAGVTPELAFTRSRVRTSLELTAQVHQNQGILEI